MTAPSTRAENPPGTLTPPPASGSGTNAVPRPGHRPQCDLIMQGGITSGIVYPSAVDTLHTRYDFHSIGGASAGAIGAALTAAAQYADHARRRDPSHAGGFDALVEASRKIASPGLLLNLFQPSRGTAWVFGLFFGLQGARGLAGRARIVAGWAARHFLAPALVAAAIAFGGLEGVLAGFGGGLRHTTWYGWVLLLLGMAVTALLGLVAAVILRLWRTVRGLPGTFYGACTGMPVGRGTREALTPWLHQQIQACAGRADADPPLTFADLAHADSPDERIVLEMMTTDLSGARPLSLPFTDARFLYSPAEFATLFPRDVLEHLHRVSTPVPPRGTAAQGGQSVPGDLRTFPTLDLPVIVGTRMSLSFPALISAVPLWAPGAKGTAPVRHWFSDGGISSNFPIHFFDAWLPARPTFGLSLVPAPRGTTGASEEPPPGGASAPVVAGTVPGPACERGQVRAVAQITGPVSFLLQIVDTMLNWRDTLQAELPGFHDRIRSIYLPEGTGGMHLTMSRDQITDLAGSGTAAGTDFLETFDFDRHLFDRYALLMRQLQENLTGGGASGASTVTRAFTPEFQCLLTTIGETSIPVQAARSGDMPAASAAAYTDTWGISARDRTLALLGLASGWAASPGLSFIQGEVPTPTPVLRMGPKV